MSANSLAGLRGVARYFRWASVFLVPPHSRASQRAADQAEWRDVENTIACLDELTRSTESEFLEIGDQLAESRTISRQIAASMQGLDELLSGKEGRDVSAALTGVLSHLRAMGEQVQEGGEALQTVIHSTTGVHLAFKGLPQMAATFRALCTLTQIETSRLRGTGTEFGDLAAEVRPLSDKVRACGHQISQASTQLIEDVRQALQRAGAIRNVQFQEIQALGTRVVESLAAFEERRRRAVEISIWQTKQYEFLTQAVEDMVQSMQFHDITRQQVEHVVEALRHLTSERDATGGGLSARGRTVLTLQASQVAAAAETFTASVARLDHNLEAIARGIRDITASSRELVGLSGSEQESFFVKMEGHFTAILALLEQFREAQAALGLTAAGLNQTIAGMRESVAAIREIEDRIQRISLNATVRAVHIGAAGNALEAIAAILQERARESNVHTASAAQALDAMSAATVQIVDLRTGTTAEGEGDVAAKEMKRTVLAMHSSVEQSFARIHEIAELGARLESHIKEVRTNFTVGRTFAEVAGRCRDVLGRAGRNRTGEGAGHGADPLDHAALRYTMQHEREVHAAVANGLEARVPSCVPRSPAGGSAAGRDDLGENVELF